MQRVPAASTAVAAILPARIVASPFYLHPCLSLLCQASFHSSTYRIKLAPSTRFLPLSRFFNSSAGPLSSSPSPSASPSPSPSPPPLPPLDVGPPSHRILFFGSDSFSLRTLQLLTSYLSSSPSLHIEVVCPADKTKHVGPVKAHAIKHNLTLHEVPAKTDFRLTNYSPPTHLTSSSSSSSSAPVPFDLAIVVSFGYLLPFSLLSRFPLGVYNLHPSLLPAYRGAAPIQHALWRGEKETGLSVIELESGEVKQMDGGKIMYQERVEIGEKESYKELSERLALRGAQCVVHVINQLEKLKKQAQIQPTLTQPSTSSSSSPAPSPSSASPSPSFPSVWPRAPKIVRSAGLLNWNDGAESIWRQWRALNGFISVYSFFLGYRIEFHQLQGYEPSSSANLLASGSVHYDAKRRLLIVQCGDNNCILVSELQMENKNRVTAASFANGYIMSDGKHAHKSKSNTETQSGQIVFGQN